MVLDLSQLPPILLGMVYRYLINVYGFCVSDWQIKHGEINFLLGSDRSCSWSWQWRAMANSPLLSDSSPRNWVRGYVLRQPNTIYAVCTE